MIITSLLIGLALYTEAAHAYISAADFMAQAIENDGAITAEDFALPEMETGSKTTAVSEEPILGGGSSYISNDDFGAPVSTTIDAETETGAELTEVTLYRDGEPVGTIFLDSEGNIVDPNTYNQEPEEVVIEPEVIEVVNEEPESILEEEDPIEPMEEMPTEEELRGAAPEGGMNMTLAIGAGVAVMFGASIAFFMLKKKSAAIPNGGVVATPGATSLEKEKHDRMQAALANMRKS